MRFGNNSNNVRLALVSCLLCLAAACAPSPHAQQRTAQPSTSAAAASTARTTPAQVQTSGSDADLEKADYHFQRGRKFRNDGNLIAARDEFRRTTEITPTSGNAFYMLAITLDDLGETQAAKRTFEQAILLNPDDAVSYSGYGEVLRKMRDYAGARHQHEKALALSRDDQDKTGFLIALGDAQEKTGDVRAAQANFERATQQSSEPRVLATAYFRLGYLLAEHKSYQKAIEALQRGIALDPTDTYAQRRLKELERDHKTPAAKPDAPGKGLPGAGGSDGIYIAPPLPPQSRER